MSSNDRRRDGEDHELFGYLAAGFMVSAAAVYVVPSVGLGVLLGGVLGAAAPWTFTDDAESRRWRSRAASMAAAGLAILVIYVLARPLLGADAEARRFGRSWSFGDTDVSAFVEHPWAWLPVAAGVASMVAGGVIWWRAR